MMGRKIIGAISVTGRGTGYVAHPDFKEDIEIEEGYLNTALHKDEVEIMLHPQKSGKRLRGEVLKVTRRAKKRFTGTIQREHGLFFLEPDDRKMYTDIAIIDPAPNLKPNFKAYVEIVLWKDPKKNPEGKILSIIGPKGDHETEMRAIALERGFETTYPTPVMEEAERISKLKDISHSEISKRRDFRKTTTFTIDPKDAKDFDDALSIKKISDGKYEIGVHIADVSHYVLEGSALDREARERGFSVYLVDRTIPMLPEVLSNELCSLNPKEDRLTFSAVFTIEERGKKWIIGNKWFGKTIIHSDKRFTYESAQETLNNKSGEFFEELRILDTIAKYFRDEKFKAGAIDFDQEEIGFELDKNGKPLSIYKKERLDTHKLVEEFMLLANREVAEFFYKRQMRKGPKGKPFIYRIHDVPNAEKIAELSLFVRALGHELPKAKNVSAKDLQALFKKIEGLAEESLIKTAAIRSMAKAAYSTGNIGHFGLAFEYYTHFTSPIRRYSDLLVHRLLQKELCDHQIKSNEFVLYQKIAAETSQKEIAAAEAERESKKLKQVEYMQNFIGKEFEGIISGVTEWGIYLEEKNTRSEGMVRLKDIPDDFYVLDEKNYAVVGTRTKKKYALGDKVRFKIKAADPERKMLDYKIL